jgi:hypothetical protein
MSIRPIAMRFCRALAHRLRGELIGDGNLARAIWELMSGGYFKPPPVMSAPQPRATDKLRQAPAILASARR